ncbi:hypothetical protein E2C01_035451 [Portunus trituberculatus]|uniref:Uncharacterized protein n=1 Tax=Portunus trituberculatus TaxID=210409 RepID=A0A5B7FBI0_PORTR|nr:hypothetical protein [Portunus trituberculatus]
MPGEKSIMKKSHLRKNRIKEEKKCHCYCCLLVVLSRLRQIKTNKELEEEEEKEKEERGVACLSRCQRVRRRKGTKERSVIATVDVALVAKREKKKWRKSVDNITVKEEEK